MTRLHTAQPELALRSVTLTAKEKVCLHPDAEGHPACLPELCPYANGYYERIIDALAAQLDGAPQFDRAALEAAARDADLLCMDATYADDADLPKARLYGHTTCREAGELAAAAAVRRLWLTHYSAAVTDTAPGLAAARTAYPLALAGYDGMAQELEFDKE